jgi:multicomponent Na+:H+ antiporter subunit D
MIGVPPTAGFVSKWYLGLGGLAAGQGWVVPVLGASSLLNAAYFLPIVHAAWFRDPDPQWPARPPGARLEAPALLVPPPSTALLMLVASGVFAGFAFSPLGLARMAAGDLYGP